MKTLQLTKYVARQAILTYKYANEEVQGRDIRYLEQQTTLYNEKYDNITTKDGAFIYVRYHKEDKYTYMIDCHKMCLHPIVEINGKRYTIEEINEFLGDLNEEQQKEALQNFPIQLVEKYIEKRTGWEIKFSKIKLYKHHGQYTLDFYTDNLIEKSGVCRGMLKEIHIEIRGIDFSINPDTGEQYMWIPAIYFRYTHIDNSTNGHEMGRIRYNGQYQGYNYETETWENI